MRAIGIIVIALSMTPNWHHGRDCGTAVIIDYRPKAQEAYRGRAKLMPITISAIFYRPGDERFDAVTTSRQSCRARGRINTPPYGETLLALLKFI